MKKNITAGILFVLILTSMVSYLLFTASPDRFKSLKIKTSGAKESMDLWTYKRSYPFNDIPADAYYKAFEYSKNYLNKEASLTSWTPIGPHNIGGRTLAVEFNPLNPATIYAGSAGGGLWRSYTGGVGAAAWQYIETGYPVLGVNTIAIPPNDSNTIYIGTGEVYGYQQSIGGIVIRTTRGSYGLGVLKSTNSGQTWTKSLDWSYNQQRGVEAIAVDPVNTSVVWAATSEGTYKSTNGGTTWNLMHNVIMATDVKINHLNTNVVYVACGNLGSAGNGIYRTTDGGTNWQKLTSGLPAAYGGKANLNIFKSNPQVVYASIGNGSETGSGTWLCKTTNGGDNWTIVSTTDYATYQGWYSHFVGVHPLDQNFLICGGIDVWKSTNGGTTLTKKTDWSAWYFGTPPPGGPEGPPNYVHADLHSVTFHPTNPNIIYFGTDGGVFRTTDGGENYAGCNGGYQSTQFYSGFSSSPANSHLAIGGLQDNATAIYKGGVAWTRVIGGDGCQTAMHPADTNIMYGTYQYLALQRSSNYGNGWSYVAPSTSGVTAFAAPVILAPSAPAVLYAGSEKIHKSTSSGSNWTNGNGNVVLDGNPIIALAVSKYSPDTVYAATAPIVSRARIFVSFNGGTSFTNITGSLPDRYPEDIVVDPSNAKTVYVAFSGFGSSHLFKSTNAGTDWTDIGISLPDVPASAVIVDPLNSNNLFFGNDLGVYFSVNGGQTWQQFFTGMPMASMVSDLSISLSDRKLRAVTHGNGVYEAYIDQIVPVELVSFTAVKNGSDVILNWATASELNNRGFEIERSFEPVNWNIIGFVNGNGTTNNNQSYTFTDHLAGINYTGKFYYRLKQLDHDGSFKYSQEISVEGGIGPDNISLYQNYPNPFNPVTRISFYLPNDADVTLKIFNGNGEQVAVLVSERLIAGMHTYDLDAASYNLSSGVYYYSIQDVPNGGQTSGSIQTRKMVLLK